MVIELPEGNNVFIDWIANIGPRFEGGEFGGRVPGASIELGSGTKIKTEETVERLMEQVAECRAREIE